MLTKESINHKIRIAALGSFVISLFMAAPPVFADEKDFRAVLDESGKYFCLSPDETELVGLVNSYRASHGLPVIPNSRSLNKVARTHVLDLFTNRPADGKDIHGQNCNLHSWSYNGSWTPVCYTKGTNNPELMWYKAKEITSYVYSAPVYENAYWTSQESAVPIKALTAWKKSPSHNALILETGVWKGLNSKAVGVGIYKGFAVIWVGEVEDKAGSMDPC